MMEFIRFTFQSFWHFIGMSMLISLVLYYLVNGIVKSIALISLRNKPEQLKEILKEETKEE